MPTQRPIHPTLDIQHLDTNAGVRALTKPGHSKAQNDQEKAPVPSRFRRLTLRVVAGRDMLQFITLAPGDEVVIGRDETGGMVLGDASVSRRHVRLSYMQDNTIAVQDLGSTNGTCILQQPSVRPPPIERGVLTVGAYLEVGAVLLQLEWLHLEQLGHLERLLRRMEEPMRDSATGLFAPSWLETTTPLLQKHARNSLPFCGLWIEPDSMESLHIRLGHRMTQEFLIGFSRLIMWRLRDSDYCVQLGERSIWVMLPETTLEEGRDVATRLKREVSSYWWPRSMGGVRALPKIGIANWMLQEPITDWIDRAQASVKHPTIRSAGLS